MKSMRILCPNGHLGFAPTKEESFRLGAATQPDFYCCDSGSDDIGPGPLGGNYCTSPAAWQKHDLELMLLAARQQQVPMIIGSAGDTGSRRSVDLYVGMIRDIARQHRLPPFKLGYFYSDVSMEFLRKQQAAGVVIEGLDSRPALTGEDLDRTDRVVAVAGVHPFIDLLDQGAEVIIGGRSSDCAVFAAPAIRAGFPESLSYFLGKALECASFCAEPYMAKESVIGTISGDEVLITAVHPKQRCTPASVAGHAMYERANPYYEYVAGGVLDMTECRYEQYDEKTCRVTGPKFVPIEGNIKVKLEGSGKRGERYVGLVGIRDPYSIARIDTMIEWARSQVRERLGEDGWQLFYHVFGKNGVMGDLEPVKEIRSHELCVVVEGMASTKERAEEVAMIGTRQLFYARLPQVKGTAGSAAFLLDEVMPASPAYEWTLNHVIPAKDPMSLFETHLTDVREGVS